MNLIDVIEQEGIMMIDKGAYWLGDCPFHADVRPSFVVYKDPGNKYYCFGCKVRGDAIDFIMKFKDMSFTKAVEYMGIEHNVSQVFIPYPSLIEKIIELDGKECPKEKSQYKELLIAMGWIKEG